MSVNIVQLHAIHVCQLTAHTVPLVPTTPTSFSVNVCQIAPQDTIKTLLPIPATFAFLHVPPALLPLFASPVLFLQIFS